MECKDQKQKKMLNFSRSLPKSVKMRIFEDQNFLLPADKSLGQNFLNDPQICDQIALSCGNLSDDLVIEVGPGMGNLTQAMLALHPGVEIVAIEADERFIPVLNEISRYYSGCKLHIIKGDALRYDFQSLVEENSNKRVKIIANLPYNIGTELLFRWLNVVFLSKIDGICVMLQKEVVSRITAQKSTKAYSWLSILSQLLCDVEELFDVPKECFVPQPKVVSSVVSLVPKKLITSHNIEKLKIICHEMFLHRRKTVASIVRKSSKINCLMPHIDTKMSNMRPEDLDITTFCRLSLL